MIITDRDRSSRWTRSKMDMEHFEHRLKEIVEDPKFWRWWFPSIEKSWPVATPNQVSGYPSIQKNDGTGVGFPPEIRVWWFDDFIKSNFLCQSNCLGWWYHMHVFLWLNTMIHVYLLEQIHYSIYNIYRYLTSTDSSLKMWHMMQHSNLVNLVVR